jgi:methylated-DNA-[protein]-cysteine S-methyltransferase
MAEELRFFIDKTPTPIGELTIVADGDGNLRAVEWSDDDAQTVAALRRRYGAHLTFEPRHDPSGLTTAINNYFAGDLRAIDRLPVKAVGTAFQQAVWQSLRDIPCGTTLSYSELARRIGRPRAVRAVGLANGANPIGIVVPCHRVIGASGTLTGYGGGIERKRWLLAHEGLGQLPLD